MNETFIYPMLDWIRSPLNATISMIELIVTGGVIHLIICAATRTRVKIHQYIIEQKTVKLNKTLRMSLI
jgi:hypothetical protein